MTLMYREPTRLLSTLFDSPTGLTRATAGRAWIPAMDLTETAQDFVIRADLPGLSADEVAIDVEDRILTISGERGRDELPEGARYLRVERAGGSFRRTLTLPDGVDADAVAASFENGVLEVRIPKPEARKPRRIEIKGVTTPPTIEA